MAALADGSYGDISWTEPELGDGVVQENVPFSGNVIDFESDDPVADAQIEVFLANEIAGAPDASYTSDSSGAFAGTLPTCSPYTYRVSTDPALGETKTTIEAGSRLRPRKINVDSGREC